MSVFRRKKIQRWSSLAKHNSRYLDVQLQPHCCTQHLNNNYLWLVEQIDWNQPAEAIHNWIRGNDRVPGAWAEIDGKVSVLINTNKSTGNMQRLLVKCIKLCAKTSLVATVLF